MAVFTGNGSAASPSFTFSGDTNTGLYSVVNGTMGIVTDGADRIVINNLGNVTVGASAPVSIPTFTTHRLQVHGTTWGSTGAVLGYWSNSSSTTNLIFAKSRGTTVGSQGLSVNADALGSIYSYGSDGINLRPATRILSSVDGTAAAGSMPGRIQFYTTPSGSTTPAEIARFTSDKYLRMASGTGGIQFNGDTSADNALDDYEEGTWVPSFSFGGTNVPSTQTAPKESSGYYVKIGRMVHAQGRIFLSSADYTAAGSPTGNMTIGSLPFAPSNSPYSNYTAGATFLQNWAADYRNGNKYITARTTSNSSNLVFYSNSVSSDVLTDTIIDFSFGDCLLAFSIQYIA